MPPDTIVRFADDVSRMLSDVMRKFLRRQTKEVVQGNISLPQVFILDALKDKSSMRMGELAGHLSVSMAAVTGIADKLVKSGFVLRGSVLGDRRVVNISITAKGREVIRRHNRARHKAIMDMFGHLSAEDREKYLEILTKIHQHLK
ncbi:MAG: MarR family transcriptional regulator [Candidatus Omnitrophota bacterium]